MVTLARWKESAQPSEPEEDPSTFRPVTVVDGTSECDLVLLSPAGWRIEGLSVAELVEVARRLQ